MYNRINKMSTTSKNTKSNKNMEDNDLALKYQQKTDKQHILDNPDTYIGSVEKVDANLWVLSEAKGVNEIAAKELNEVKTEKKIVERNMTYIPGLF